MDDLLNGQFTILRYVSENGNIRKFVFTSRNQDGTFETSSFFTPARTHQGGTSKTPSFATPDYNIHDICISTMAGCSMGCQSCSTTFSPVPFERVLTADEMYFQVKVASQERRDLAADTIIRIGFMGNGEPMGNFYNMLNAIRRLVFDERLPIGIISISTIGVNISHLPELAKLMAEIGIGIKLQLSLYSVDRGIRQRLLPLAPPLETVLPQLDWYAGVSGMPVRYNVPLILGVNNSVQQLEGLRDFLLEKPDLRRLKLSAYNAFPGVTFQACPDEELFQTCEWFESFGVKVDLFLGDRDSLVLASCGQMRSVALQS